MCIPGHRETRSSRVGNKQACLSTSAASAGSFRCGPFPGSRDDVRAVGRVKAPLTVRDTVFVHQPERKADKNGRHDYRCHDTDARRSRREPDDQRVPGSARRPSSAIQPAQAPRSRAPSPRTGSITKVAIGGPNIAPMVDWPASSHPAARASTGPWRGEGLARNVKITPDRREVRNVKVHANQTIRGHPPARGLLVRN